MVTFTPKGLIKPDPPSAPGAEDGDIVDINQINANLDRISEMGAGARAVLSSGHPGFGSIDDSTGTIIYETDSKGVLVRRENTSSGGLSLDTNYMSVMPGRWAEWNTNNIFSTWLSGDNNYKHARVTFLGRLVHVHIEMVIGEGGDVTAGMLPNQLPIGRDTDSVSGFGDDDITAGPWPVGYASATLGGTVYFGRILLVAAQPVVRTISDSATSAGSAWGASVPANWAVGDSASFDFTYWSY
jgi:hypothetical protein